MTNGVQNRKLDAALASGDWRNLRSFPEVSGMSDGGLEGAFHKLRVARNTVPEHMR